MNSLKAISLAILIYPQSVNPAIHTDVGVGRFFAIAVKEDLVNGRCAIIKDGYAGSANELDAINGALSSCGRGCVLVVSFRTVQ